MSDHTHCFHHTNVTFSTGHYQVVCCHCAATETRNATGTTVHGPYVPRPHTATFSCTCQLTGSTCGCYLNAARVT